MNKFSRIHARAPVTGSLRTAVLVALLPACLALGNANAAEPALTSDTSCIDTDGDGWGWDGTQSCLTGSGPVQGDCIDTDGDGWGWDGIQSCLIEDTPAECIDTDGDGWGWDGEQSCRPTTPGATSNLVETAVAAGNFTILATALQVTGLDTVLSDPSASYTVFAPTDKAFEALGSDTIDALVADPDGLADILLYHVVGGAVDSSTALSLAGSTVETAAGGNIALSINDGSLYINTSRVTATDIVASNGTIHVLDKVLLPPSITHASGTIVDVAVANGNFNTLVTALQLTGLDSVLADTTADYTVFAPTDAAFAALGDETIAALISDTDALTAILLKHVVAGAVNSTTALSITGSSVETAGGSNVDLSIQDNALFVGNSRVITTDIQTDNGIIHVIDAVIQ